MIHFLSGDIDNIFDLVRYRVHITSSPLWLLLFPSMSFTTLYIESPTHSTSDVTVFEIREFKEVIRGEKRSQGGSQSITTVLLEEGTVTKATTEKCSGTQRDTCHHKPRTQVSGEAIPALNLILHAWAPEL